jgi:UDP-glucose 4-epimerase
MECLVTGGAGFIGSHLVDRLLADGHRVTVLDDFTTGRRDNLSHHDLNRELRIIESDITCLGDDAMKFDGIDWVFHLAALADIVPSIERPLEYHRTNVSGTVVILELARKADVKRFIYAASSSCYGIPDGYPTSEAAPIRPLYPYALTKHLGEEYVLHWATTFNIPAVSLRLFNVYGPRSRTSGAYGAVFGVFLAQKLAGKPFTVVGDGTQSRDFTFVTDVVDAFIRAAESDLTGEVLNVGRGTSNSVNRLVELLGGEVVYIPKRPGEPDRTLGDISKIRRLLGWEPQVPFEAGVQVMLDNIEHWRGAPIWTAETIDAATKLWFRHLGGGTGNNDPAG